MITITGHIEFYDYKNEIGWGRFSDAEKWYALEVYAENLLILSSWTQSPDSGLTFTQKTDWLNYRQALRELRETFVNPDDVAFLEVPTYG